MGRINIIACIDQEGSIGLGGELPWPTIPEDMARFRRLTDGGACVMGRETWNSICRSCKDPADPLPGRQSVVIHSEGAELLLEPDLGLTPKGGSGAHGAVAFARSVGAIDGDIWICGGERLYREFLPSADRVYLTVLQGAFEADRHWPIDLLDPVDIVGWDVIRPITPLTTPFGLRGWMMDLERTR